jgi:hypothetical protein
MPSETNITGLECSGVNSQTLDIQGKCCIGSPFLNYSGISGNNQAEVSEGSEDNKTISNDPCALNPYFIGATRTISYLSSSFGSIREEYGIPWHWPSPEYPDLEKYSTDFPPLFGFIGGSFPTAKEGEKPRSKSVDQKCLSTYARFNLFKDDIVTTEPDQMLLGRYTRLTKNYYHSFLSENINELTGQVVKWREYGWWPYIMTALSLSFWIGGCGEPCYRCSYKDNYCIGNGEHALNLVIFALDQYWLTDKAEKGNLYPSDKFLVDYYGTIIRGPEPTIGWTNYLLFRKETCSYCGCIIFCKLAACIDPWFMKYSSVSSVMTLNSQDGIPQRLPGRFIQYVEYIKEQLKDDDIEKKPILWDHFAGERLFIDGKVDYYDGQIYNPGGLDSPPSGYLLGSQLDKNNKGSETIGQDYIELEDGKLAYATKTNSSGFHMEEVSGSQDGLKDSIFFGFRTKGSADDEGYFIRNVAVKYYDHNVRKDIFKYNWLYVDIPKALRVEVTPVQTSFDNFSLPDMYFDDTDPLTVMRKDVTFKTILKSGDMVLNGNGSKRLSIGDYALLFDGITNSDKFYPLLWVDRVETKTVKAPYNLYFKSGSDEFIECQLGEALTGLSAGRYYFPNPYACVASPRMAIYDGNIHAGIIGRDYSVFDMDNHKKYFSVELPMQFMGVTGENRNQDGIKDYKKMLKSAKKILGNPENGTFTITSMGNSGDSYTSGPIEEFPVLSASRINEVEITNWSNTGIPWYSEKTKFDRKKMLQSQIGLFNADLRNYDKKWWNGYII